MLKHNNKPEDVNMLRKLGYERSDVDVRSISKSLIWFFGFLAASMVISFATLKFFIPTIANGEKIKPFDSSKVPANAPILQSNPKTEMKEFWTQEMTKTNHYGWVDEAKQVAHEPVEVALERIASGGTLPKADAGGIEKDLTKPISAENSPNGVAPTLPKPAGLRPGTLLSEDRTGGATAEGQTPSIGGGK